MASSLPDIGKLLSVLPAPYTIRSYGIGTHQYSASTIIYEDDDREDMIVWGDSVEEVVAKLVAKLIGRGVIKKRHDG